MAYDAINLSPQLMSWRLAGVDCLLADTDLPPEFSLCPVPAGGLTPPLQVTQAAQSPRPAYPARPARVTQMRPAQEQSVPKQTPRPSATTPEITLLPLEQWPASWQERLRATKPASVLWTYWALGEDMCGIPNPVRRDFLQRILKDMRELGHPAGTHSFWPVALPVEGPSEGPNEGSNLVAHPSAFWSGVEMLKARALVVMGSPAVKAIALPTGLRPLQHTRCRGKLIAILRDIDFLANEVQEYESVRAFLRETLTPFAAHTYSANIF